MVLAAHNDADIRGLFCSESFMTRTLAFAVDGSGSRSATVRPIGAGAATVTISDMCFDPALTSTVQVDVTEVSRINMHGCNKMEVGKTVAIYVQPYDSQVRSNSLLVVDSRV
jgi:hypothetical protein